MRMDVLTGNLPNSDAVDQHAHRRLSYALDRFAERVREVRVRLGDLSGPKGGAAKRCAIECDLGRLGSVLIEETDSDLYAAIDRASKRVKVAVRRKLDKAKAAWRGRR
jgi:ribosome-associated translation inhibitor RaiA